MANLVTYDCRPDLKRPIFIEGLPGVGNVGKITADFVSYKLQARRMARIISDDLPPQVMVDEECAIDPACNELWYVEDVNGHDVIFLLGEFQSTTPQGQFRLCKDIFDMIIPYDPSLIITLGGYGTGGVVHDPRVLGAVSHPDMRSKMEEYGVCFYPNEPHGGIVGAAAMFVALGAEYDIDSICIMGETSGYIADTKSAENLINVLSNLLGTEIDTSELKEEIDAINDINKEAEAQAISGPKEDLSYIG